MENKGGLNLLPKDERDINLGEIVTLPKLEELPADFSLGDTIIRNQEKDGNSDFCTAYGTCGMAYLQDNNIEGSQEWVFAASKELSGDPEGFGQNMRDAFKAWVKYGSPLRNEVKVPENPKDRRYFKNYDPNLTGDVLKKQTYVTCKGPYDALDNIRASIWKYRNEKRAAGIGVVFSWPLSDIFLRGINDNGFGHFMFVTGWTTIDGEILLEVVNSYGKEAGQNGKHYLSRETIEYFVSKYGAYLLVDIPLEEARRLSEKPAEKKSIWTRFIEAIKHWLNEIFK